MNHTPREMKFRENQFYGSDKSTSDRTERRKIKKSFISFCNTIKDKYWFMSLTIDEQESLHRMTIYPFSNYTESDMKRDFPGCLNTKRDMKIDSLLS